MRSAWIPTVLVAAWLGCAAPQLPAPERAAGPGGSAHYHVRVDESLSTLWAEVCFAGEPPSAMVPLGSEASQALVQVYDSEGVEVPLPADRRRIPLARFGPGAGQLRCHLAQGRVEQFCRFVIQLFRGAPSGKAIHGKPVEYGEKYGEDADHAPNMYAGGRGARVE